MMSADGKGEARKRILFVNHSAQLSGPAHSLMMLLPYLRRRYEAAVLLDEPGFLSEWLAREGVPVFFLPEQGARSLLALRSLIRRERIALVYGNNPGSASRRAILAGRLAGARSVWHFRGVKWHWGWRKGAFLRLADRVVAVSGASARSLARFYPLEKMRVVHNGVEALQFSGDREESRRRLEALAGIPPGERILMMVSHVKPRKGQDEAVAVMERLARLGACPHLVIAGSLEHDPAYVEQIRARIRRGGLERRVHLLGLRQDIPRLLAGADLFLHTAAVDAHPRAVVEAMAAALPVVSFAVDGVAETVVDGETGYLAPEHDCEAMAGAVLSLLEDPLAAAAFGMRGRERAERDFSAAGTARKVEAIISELI